MHLGHIKFDRQQKQVLILFLILWDNIEKKNDGKKMSSITTCTAMGWERQWDAQNVCTIRFPKDKNKRSAVC